MIRNLYKKIKILRVQNGFSQEYMARKLNMSRPTYSQIEKGERELTISEIKKLADIFGIQIENLLTSKKVEVPKVTFKKPEKQASSKKLEIRISVPQKNLAKFKEVLLYILEKVGAKPNIGETALYKLLYFVDFDFFEKYEEQLIGASYVKNLYGPTPIEFKKVIEEMKKKGEVERVRSKYFQYDQKKYLPRRGPNLSKLTAQEIKHIDEVLYRLSDKNVNDLTEYSHSDIPWLVHKTGEIISYESVFYRGPDHSIRNYDDEL